jgi:hypothetical protein
MRESSNEQRKRRSVGEVVTDANNAYAMAEKPSWCQPWTILVAGTAAGAGSVVLFRGNLLPLALIVNAGVLVWWYVFLVRFPVYVLDSERGVGRGGQR